MIHEVKENKCFVISSHGIWLPGSYETKQAANYAFRFSGEILRKLQDSINPGGSITMEILRGAKKMSK